MESITKNHLSEGELCDIARLAFGEKCDPVCCQELEGGFCNAAYLMDFWKAME